MSPVWDAENRLVSAKGIAIRNIWLLMLYASECFGHLEHTRRQTGNEAPPENEHLPDLVAEVLLYFARERLLRGLTRCSQAREADLPRVRGGINMLRTESRQLLARGRVACRFHEPTLNTPRNRLIKAALEKGAQLAKDSVAVACRDYAAILYRMGVTEGLPDRHTLSKETDTINTREDRFVLAAARLLLDMALPQTQRGQEHLLLPEFTEEKLRRLFERAVRGFYRVTASEEWHVAQGNVPQKWGHRNAHPDIDACLPRMELDIVLKRKSDNYKVVIDTKFTPLLKSGQYREESLSSAYLYQMYAYLRTQEEQPHGQCATGILLHPALEASNTLTCTIQGHAFVFAAVNLNAPAPDIRHELLCLLPKVMADGLA